MVEMGSFVAILFGQVLGAWLATHPNYELMTSIAVLAIGLAGYLASRRIPNTPALSANLAIQWNPIIETYKNVKANLGTTNLMVSNCCHFLVLVFWCDLAGAVSKYGKTRPSWR